jgi:branched-chain amino acid transport system substrate-binding protein
MCRIGVFFACSGAARWLLDIRAILPARSRIAALCAALTPLAWATPAAARVELGAPAASADVTIGCMFPMTGRSAIYGKDSVGGIRVALERLSAQYGSSAPRLRVLVDDDRSKASYAVRLAEDYIRRDHARFLCGIVSSGVAEAVSRVAARREVILVGTDHASSRLTIEDFHPHYFRLSNDTFSSMAAGARYLSSLQRRSPWRRLAFIGPDYDYGHVSLVDLRASLDRLGTRYEVVGELWPKLYEPDYSTYIRAILRSKPDIVVVALWGGDFVAFLKQAVAADLFKHARLANFDTGGNYDVMLSLGAEPPPGLILSARHHNNWPDTPLNQWFVQTFHGLEGRYPTYAAEGAYSGIIAIGEAVRRAGGASDTDALVRTLEGMRLELPEDPTGFASTIDPETHQVMQMQAVGEVVPDLRFPPARVMLGRWVAYGPDDLRPPPDLLRMRRAGKKGVQHVMW